MRAVKELIEINGKKVLMTFGIRFLEQMGEKYSSNINGVTMRGLHYASILTELQTNNPVVVFNMIRLATENNPNLMDEEIEDYVFEQLEDEQTEMQMFDDFFDIFKKLPGAKRYVKGLETLKVQEKSLEEEKVKTTKKTTAK